MDLMHVSYFLGFAILILIEIITYPKVKKWKPKYKTISVMIAGIVCIGELACIFIGEILTVEKVTLKIIDLLEKIHDFSSPTFLNIIILIITSIFLVWGGMDLAYNKLTSSVNRLTNSMDELLGKNHNNHAH